MLVQIGLQTTGVLGFQPVATFGGSGQASKSVGQPNVWGLMTWVALPGLCNYWLVWFSPGCCTLIP